MLLLSAFSMFHSPNVKINQASFVSQTFNEVLGLQMEILEYKLRTKCNIPPIKNE